MRRATIPAAAWALAAALFLWETPTARADALEAGVAACDITPPVGYRMSGYFRERLSTGTLNPLMAKALVLKQGDVRAAIVTCDIIGLSLDVSGRARAEASAKTGIPAENILIAATHTHTGPLYGGALRKHFHDLAVARHGRDPCEAVDYPKQLVAKLVKVVADASAAAGPVSLAAGACEQQGLSFNRRFHMKDGSVRFNPGAVNPNIVRPAGPIDPQVGIVMVRDAAGGNPRAAIVNFALHLDTVGGTKYHADFPYFLQQALREAWGEQFTLLFGTGACGDINHVDVTRKRRLKTETIGRTLGETVAKADLKQVEAYKILAIELRGGDTIPLEVQVFRFSKDVALVGLPGEVFVDLGLAIKRASPFATTLVVELCHDAPGYIPTKKAFAEGSYETVNSRIAPGGGEMMAEAAVRLLRELADGAP